MKNYCCESCKMEVAPLTCGKCKVTLINKVIEKDKKSIEVAECPQCHGKIKSPQCCGMDMKHP